MIWPENSTDIDPYRNADASAVISAAAEDIGVPILVGAVVQGPGDPCHNIGIVWDPVPAPGPAQPTPSGTRCHSASTCPTARSSGSSPTRSTWSRGTSAAGDGPGDLDVGPAHVGDVICFEVVYDDLVRDVVNGGAEVLVVQTNNATFGYTDETYQQLAMSRLRAVEAGRAVVHVSTVGISGLVEPDGRVVAGSRLFTPAVLDSTLPLRTGFTVATRLGALPEATLAAAGVMLVGMAVVRTRRRRGAAASGEPRTPRSPNPSSAEVQDEP